MKKRITALAICAIMVISLVMSASSCGLIGDLYDYTGIKTVYTIGETVYTDEPEINRQFNDQYEGSYMYVTSKYVVWTLKDADQASGMEYKKDGDKLLLKEEDKAKIVEEIGKQFTVLDFDFYFVKEEDCVKAIYDYTIMNEQNEVHIELELSYIKK